MTKAQQKLLEASRVLKVQEASEALSVLGFVGRQRNEVAAYTLLALLGLEPLQSWSNATAPLLGITRIIELVHKCYGIRYAPNTRETIRDEAVKYFVEAGMLIRNPDDPARPTNSGKTAYQIEPQALSLFRSFGGSRWSGNLRRYRASRELIRQELTRERSLKRVPVRLPRGGQITLSPGGQNPLIKAVIEEFCSRFVPAGRVLYVGDAESKFLHLDEKYLASLGVRLASAAKMPDIVIHATDRNWLVLIEAVTTAGPVDGKRRAELKNLFSGSTAGLVFVTAFASRVAMRSFLTQISWETEVWSAEDPDHLIFNGERFLGPYPDVSPK